MDGKYIQTTSTCVQQIMNMRKPINCIECKRTIKWCQAISTAVIVELIMLFDYLWVCVAILDRMTSFNMTDEMKRDIVHFEF